MSYLTNKTQTVPLWGGGALKFNKSELYWIGEVDGITAIKIASEKDPIKIRLDANEFFNDFYASRSL